MIPVRLATNTPGKPIKVGSQPEEIAITPNGKTIYVIDDSNEVARDTVVPVTIATGKVGKAIKVGVNPQSILIVP